MRVCRIETLLPLAHTLIPCLQRMNRLSCQESENEVALAKLKGQVRDGRILVDRCFFFLHVH